ncbi:SRPBCC family protein [Alteribacter natronophilus]|uniref:SRPBCC family protein n=1 Tax=Alteribacter natronophilus TaxID=2583810 RepID=UPI00110EB262|nr:SRPBCC family protein [Alteribacter natronophilus]TMW73312.1 DUF3284 domain-containing protein [Alteribacter natronophilus]
MADLYEEITVNEKREKVFAFASDLQNSPEVLANVVEVNKLTDGPVEKGTEFEEVRQFRNRRVGSIIKVKSYDPPSGYAVESENRGLLVTYTYTFAEKDGQTKIIFEGNVTTRGFVMKMMRPLMVRMLKKEDGEHLVSLKNAIEKRNELPE